MAVQLEILSGARQGDQIGIENDEFRAGDQPDCDVCFDPQRDPHARNRSATFKLTVDGWSVRSTGVGDVFVNHELVRGTVRVRSGDVVRISDQGPDFSFTIVKQAKTVVSAPPSGAPTEAGAPPEPSAAEPSGPSTPPESPFAWSPSAADPPSPSAETPRRWEPAAPEPAGGLVPLVLVAGPADHSAAIPPLQGASGPSRAPVSPVILLATAAVSVAVLALVVIVWLVSGPDGSEPGGTAGEEAVASALAQGQENSNVEEQGEIDSPGQANEEQDPATSPSDPVQRSAWADLPDRLAGAVLLVKARHRDLDAAWPHSTCAAVGESTLLTTAALAVDLAHLRDQGFQILASEGTGGPDVEISEILVHTAFVRPESTFEEQTFSNLGVLKTQAPVAKTISSASTDELADVEEGYPIGCIGFTHDGEKITRFDELAPQLWQGRVFLVTSLRDFPGRPRRLEITAEIPPNAFGSPVVNEEGKLLGVFSETAAPEPGIVNLHYALVVTPDLVQSAREGGTEGLWVQPPPKEESSESQDR